MRSTTLLGAVTLLSASIVSSAIVNPATFANTSFDFIVVGGGATGAVVAVRLSEIANFTVGLIEAGDYKPDDPKLLIPQGWNAFGLWGDADYDWKFSTTPQKKLANRSIPIVRGKLLGGSSALNLLGVFLAGAVEYDQIGQLGNPGWSYKSTLRYFKKATNMSVAPKDLQIQTQATFDPKFHGNSGPIHLSFSSWFSQVIPYFYRTMVNLGFSPVFDGNDGRDEGSVWNPPLAINQDTKTRSYSAIEYYGPNANRKNLHVVTGAQVTKIEVSSTPDRSGNLRASGVTYVAGGQTYTAKMSKDIIVSAGSIQSPQVLELSGIGNKTLLESVGIQSKIDLPAVGENYQEHLVTLQDFILPSSIETWDVIHNPAKNATAYAQYEKNRTGVYTSSINAISYASAARVARNTTLLAQWLKELDQQFNASNPSIGRRRMYQIERARLLPQSQEASIEFYAAPSNNYPQSFKPNTSYIQLASIPSHPFSRGSIHVNSSNPLAYPAIDINAWDFDIDKHMFILAAKHARLIANTQPLSPIIKSYGFPGANVTTDADWEQFIAENTRLPFHPCCTNAMLPKDHGGVVDSRLKVYGSANIRVADVSILPLQLGTHLTGTAYAIGEQAADMIKADYGHH